MHFDLCGTPSNATAPTAQTTQTHGAPAHTVVVPSFPTYHTPSMAFGCADIDSLMSCAANPVNPVDPFSHTLPHAPASPHTNVHTGSPTMSILSAFHGKPVNPAPIKGLVPFSGGPPCSLPPGTIGCPFSPVNLLMPSGPPSHHGSPVPSPSSPPIPPSHGPPSSSFPTPPSGPPVGASSGSAPFLNGIDWLENHTVASTYTIQPWMFARPKVGSTCQWEYQALMMSGANFGDSDLTKPLLHKASGHQIIWQLAYVAEHPCLVESHIDVAMPEQKSNELILQCCQNWTYYLHVMYLCGIFLSNWYFAECFLCNLHGAHNSTVKPLLLHFVHIKVDVALFTTSNQPIFSPTWPLLLPMLVLLA